MELTLGTRIYYTGDMANCESAGTIIATLPATKYGPEQVRIQYDQPRFEGDTQLGVVYVSMFRGKPETRRFFLEQEWLEIQRQKMEAARKRWQDYTTERAARN